MTSFSKFLLLVICAPFILFSCQSKTTKKTADLLVFNAKIYTVDSSFSKAEAMAIKNGEIIALGSTKKLLDTYRAKDSLDVKGNTIIPGLFDAHTHFFEYGRRSFQVDLRGTQSYEEVLQRVVAFQNREQQNFITGMGWDQTNWPTNEFPTKAKLDSLFPHTPVALTRIDAHTMLVNQKALDMAGITASSTVDGGTFVKKDGELTGVLIDNARQKVQAIIPEFSRLENIKALQRAQEACLSFGLTTVAEAGISHEAIQLMDSLALQHKLVIDIYPMLLYADPHLDDYLFHGLGQNKAISCRAIKLYADGALGSRGAALKEPYSDDPGNYGKMRVSPEFINTMAEKVARSNFQLNTHAIGDSADHVVLKAYAKVLKNKPNRRWRIEHAQIVDPIDLHYFSKNIIPSVQPTHAISDMNWAEDRLGHQRVTYAYANKRLLEEAGIVALGTDFPVEKINPFRTFYTAVARQDKNGNPEGGFQADQALTRKQALKGMTIWAAYAQFSASKKGSLEPGKQADFIVLDRDIMTVPIDSSLHTQVLKTYIKGALVFNR